VISALKSPIAIGVITFIIAMTVTGYLMGPTKCNSGWASSSIGKRGACSHHGGVNRTPGMLRFLASLALGVGAGVMTAKRAEAKQELPPSVQSARTHRARSSFAKASHQWKPEAEVPSPSGGERSSTMGTTCPSCGATMRAHAIEGSIVLMCPTDGCGTRMKYR
jgi:hypothetical protein